LPIAEQSGVKADRDPFSASSNCFRLKTRPSRLGDGRLSLGDHPVADELRSLGLPKRPLLSAWMGRLAFEMSAPEKL
jgi:hypothetical protein